MRNSISRDEEIASLRIQAQRLYRSGMERSAIQKVLGVTKGQVANFLIGMPANDVRAAVPKTAPVMDPVKPASDPASFVTASRFCRPCARRVMRSEILACPNDCATKRMAGGR